MAAFLGEPRTKESVNRAAFSVGMRRRLAYKLEKRLSGLSSAKAWNEALEESRSTGPPGVIELSMT